MLFKDLPPSSIVVVGTIKDAANVLSENVKSLSLHLGNSPLSWFLIESNSTDTTVQELKKLSGIVPNFFFQSLSGVNSGDRLYELSMARERVVDHVKALDRPPEYVLMVDLDQEYDWQNVELRICLDKFDAVFCHQNPYYDILALEIRGQSSSSRKVPTSLLQDLGFKLWRFLVTTPLAQIRFGEIDQPIEVESAFGGMALYRAKVFLSGTYRPREVSGGSRIENCEHISFHKSLPESYGSRWVDPCFYAPVKNEHVRVANFLVMLKGLLVKR